jgi:TDG/mug DNA glycosylase family protein
LKLGLGITNLVPRTTATASELADRELATGASRLRGKVRRYRPEVVAFLGLDAYRRGFGARKASIGLQEERIEGVSAWVLPNTSGLNANHQLPDFVRLFGELRRFLDQPRA